MRPISSLCEDNHITGRYGPINSPVDLMLPVLVTRLVIRTLDWMAERTLPPTPEPPGHKLGRRGEEDAYFHLRKLGYTVVARNFRSPRCHGEIDMIAWDKDVICFVEVKSRTSKNVKPPEAAVDRHKRRELAIVAREYLRKLPPNCQWRIDIVSVYYEGNISRPQIELFRNAILSP